MSVLGADDSAEKQSDTSTSTTFVNSSQEDSYQEAKFRQMVMNDPSKIGELWKTYTSLIDQKLQSRSSSEIRGLSKQLHFASYGCDTFDGSLKCHVNRCRDLLAFGIASFLDIMGNGYIFGSFVSGIFSGFRYDDIDIMVPSKECSDHMMNKLHRFLCFILATPSHSLTISNLKMIQSYSNRLYVIRIKLYERPAYADLSDDFATSLTLELPVDMVNADQMKTNKIQYIPVSLGSCLRLDGSDVTYRTIQHRGLVELPKLFKLLGDGIDIKLPMQPIDFIRFQNRYRVPYSELSSTEISAMKDYQEYFWVRITLMKNKGYLLQENVATDPPKMSSSLLSNMVERQQRNKKQNFLRQTTWATFEVNSWELPQDTLQNTHDLDLYD